MNQLHTIRRMYGLSIVTEVRFAKYSNCFTFHERKKNLFHFMDRLIETSNKRTNSSSHGVFCVCTCDCVYEWIYRKKSFIFLRVFVWCDSKNMFRCVMFASHLTNTLIFRFLLRSLNDCAVSEVVVFDFSSSETYKIYFIVNGFARRCFSFFSFSYYRAKLFHCQSNDLIFMRIRSSIHNKYKFIKILFHV